MTTFKVTIPEDEIYSFKEYLQKIGADFEEEFEVSEDYKKMMDEVLLKHKSGKLEYLTEEEFRNLSTAK